MGRINSVPLLAVVGRWRLRRYHMFFHSSHGCPMCGHLFQQHPICFNYSHHLQPQASSCTPLLSLALGWGKKGALGFGFRFREFRILIPCPPVFGHVAGGSALPLAHTWDGFLIDCLLVSPQHAQRVSMGWAATNAACARMGGRVTLPQGTAPAQWDGPGWPASWVRTVPTASGHGLCHQPVPFWGGLPLG